ncbi:MAG: EamA family transporter [Christensenellales bacterium]|jgi:drug/metabolite transporter (DMT)-like permease
MWFLFSVITFLMWGAADLFYKRASKPGDRYSHLKIVVMVGLVMGLHAAFYMLVEKISFSPISIIKYLPVSSMYILSMVIGYFGLRYIQLSISSPVQNSSGAIVAILLLIFFPRPVGALEIAALVMICGGVFALSLIENRQENPARYIRENNVDAKYRTGMLAIAFPIIYCLIDGLGSFADALYLDELALMSESEALLAYEFTFFICAVISFIFLRFVKKEKFNILREKDAGVAAVFETAGQFFYVFALAGNALFAAPIVASYSIVAVILSRIFLKEKLSRQQYIVIGVVMLGIAILGFAEGG